MFNKFYSIIYELLLSVFKEKTRSRLMTQFIVVILLISLFASFSFVIFSSVLNKRFDETNLMLINSVTKNLNSVFKKVDDVFKTSEDMLLNKDIFNELGVINPDSLSKYNIVFNLNKQIMLNEFIEEIVILNKFGKILISSQGTISKE